MRKYAVLIGCLSLLAACSKHDPILPGSRTAIFATTDIRILNQDVPNLPLSIDTSAPADCPFTQDSSNIIWNGDKKIFSGFPTSNSVKSAQKPVCSGNYVYAGLTTGELVKVNAKNRKIAWIADIYRPSNLTGGASVLDIIAPIVIHDGAVYVGGLGDAFCRINATSGTKKWCADIGVAKPFIITDTAAFVVGTDNNLYAIRTSDGEIYWRTEIKTQSAPTYANKTITVGGQKIDAKTGKILQ